MKVKNLDLQGACNELAAIFKRRWDDYVWAKDHIPSWNPAIDNDVNLYLIEISYCLSGYML
jgi:hypothetical protein